MSNPFENYTGIIKTIRPSELAQHTTDGWSIIDVFDEDRVAESWGKLPRVVPHTQPQYGVDDGTVSTSTPHVVRERFFVVRQQPESELARMATELSNMRTERDDARRTSADWKNLCDRQAKEVNELKLNFDREAQLTGTLKKERVRDVEKIRKMEGDLGKVRAAIGELRMREILGEGT